MRVLLLCLLGLRLADCQNVKLEILADDGAITIGTKGDVILRRDSDAFLVAPKKLKIGTQTIEDFIVATIRAQIKPQIATCKPGYKGAFCDIAISCAATGYTGTPGQCTCAVGYAGKVIYKAGKPAGCTGISCAPDGYTGTPAKCTCANGYIGKVTYTKGKATGCKAISCAATGYAGTPSKCTCAVGYAGKVVYKAGKPAGCTGISCAPKGYTGTPAKCTCDKGYTGKVTYTKGKATGCTAATAWKMKLQRFRVGKSTGANSHTVAHQQQGAFCKARGGRLPTLQELCPSYDKSKATTPALGCEKSHSWVPYGGNTDQWMYIGCPGTGHYQCKDHMEHHGKPGWTSGDQYGDMVDCMVPVTKGLKRYNVGKSKGANSHTVAHQQQDAFCKGKGGRLPTLQELCPSYDKNKATAPALGCEKSHSWVPYSGNTDQWMYIGCPGTGHYQCKDHMTHHGKPGWTSGDQYGDMVDCMI